MWKCSWIRSCTSRPSQSSGRSSSGRHGSCAINSAASLDTMKSSRNASRESGGVPASRRLCILSMRRFNRERMALYFLLSSANGQILETADAMGTPPRLTSLEREIMILSSTRRDSARLLTNSDTSPGAIQTPPASRPKPTSRSLDLSSSRRLRILSGMSKLTRVQVPSQECLRLDDLVNPHELDRDLIGECLSLGRQPVPGGLSRRFLADENAGAREPVDAGAHGMAGFAQQLTELDRLFQGKAFRLGEQEEDECLGRLHS